ncbi:divalent cation tolerance protein CutA [Pedobacter nanyangensis]|uniref:divalent cation tolerance protein CutA n=1 Tax=Pedobacter nanyangensis TaxID=1562389 RepID=UPI000DE4AFA1|nr:divalent cation tolerance protein CutA [Pedobacter nanyangensis]
MVNIIIYLDKKNDAEDLVKHLLEAKLIASAVIDMDNISYSIKDGNFTKEVYNVITAKSKSLLTNQIVHAVEAQLGEEVLIISTPIVGSNSSFDEMVKQNTIPV